MEKASIGKIVAEAKILTFGGDKYICNVSEDGKVHYAYKLGKFSEWFCALNVGECQDMIMAPGASYTVREPTLEDKQLLQRQLITMLHAKDYFREYTENSVFRKIHGG